MIEGIIFRREENFKKWLPKNKVNSVNYYASNIRTIQNHLKEDIDKLLENGLDSALERINRNTIPQNDHIIGNYRSVLRKYWKYVNAID
jgi:hypothetical protein